MFSFVGVTNLKILLLLVFSLGANLARAQTPGVYFLNGWTANGSYQIGDSILTIGVVRGANLTGDSILISKSDLLFDYQQTISFSFDTAEQTSFNGANVIGGDGLYFSGTYKNSLASDSQLGFIAKYDLNQHGIQSKGYVYGASNFSHDMIYTKDNKIAVVGNYSEGTSKIHGYFQLLDTNLSFLVEKKYLCRVNVDNNECREMNQDIIETKDGDFIVSATYQGAARPGIGYTVLRKINHQGDVLWTYSDKNDSFGFHDPVVTKLANGNILLLAKRRYFNPYQNPNEPNRWPTVDLKGSSYITILNNEGELIERKDTRPFVDRFHQLNTVEYNFLSAENVVSTSDNGFVICGSSRMNNSVGTIGGFLMKLDSNGNYEWFRRYQPDTCNIVEGASQDTYIYAVSELDNGGFVLSGRFICDGSLDHGGGYFTPAIVIVTDESGCLEPGCQKTVGVAQQTTSNLKIAPNPSKGHFSILDDRVNEITQIYITDIQGRIVEYQREIGSKSINIKMNTVSGLYFLRIQKSNGETEVRRIVIEN